MRSVLDPNAIYTELRRRIVHLDLAPESVLNISELAEDFGVSRTPVKEALIVLQAEEWVTRLGSQLVVTPLSLERIREITEIRMVLEVQANVWAMERITPDELAELQALGRRIADSPRHPPNQTVMDYDFAVHHVIFTAAKNDQMMRILERLLDHYLRFWFSIARQLDLHQFFEETHELIAAISAKDEGRVRECTVRHIRDSVAEIMGAR